MANLAQVGLALATVAGAWVNLALLWLAARRLGFKRPATTLEGAMRLLFAGLVTGIVLHFGGQLIGPWLSDLPRLREEVLLLLLLILGALVYAALVDKVFMDCHRRGQLRVKRRREHVAVLD